MPFVLRRVKADVDLKIPPKKEVLIYCPMSEKQKSMYEATVNRTLADLVGNKDQKEKPQVNLEEGRGLRKKSAVDYSLFLNEKDDISDKKMEAYLKNMTEMTDKRESSRNSVNAYKNEVNGLFSMLQSKFATVVFSITHYCGSTRYKKIFDAYKHRLLASFDCTFPNWK